MIRKIASILCVALGLISNPIWASRIEYDPCGEESEELLTAVRSINSPRRDTVTQAVKKIYMLSENGDYYAFRIVCGFKKDDKHNLDEYISKIYNHLFANRNYSAMGKYGRILFDLGNPRYALPFLKTAWQNHLQYKHSFEDLEYDYMSALCLAVSNQHSVNKRNLEHVWDLSQKYLNRTDTYYDAHFTNFFQKIRLHNFERLINKIGHYIFENKIDVYLNIYIKIFERTIHLDRLFRQRNVIAFELNATLEHQEAMNQGVAAKKLREDNFIETARQTVKQGAIQAVGKLLTRNAFVQQGLESFGISNLRQLSPEQKNTMALFLLAIYPNRIFSGELMDNEEYIDRFLSSNIGKFKFLTQEVFEAI